MAKDRNYECEACSVNFKIEVEPGVPEADTKQHYPASMEWLDAVCACPVCGGELIVLD